MPLLPTGSSADKTKDFLVAPPSVSLPKGGGAISGIGEKFAANPVTGTASFSVPISTSPGRGGFGPSLALSYDSGAGNGPFGLGWRLGVPSIRRKTDKGLPLYRDAIDSDVFVFSEAEDLVLITEDDVLTWYPSRARQGFEASRRTWKPGNENDGPRVVFSSTGATILLADMTGDGLSDLVRVRNGSVCYWPNRGYGQFGAKVLMKGAPWFDAPDRYDPARLRLADIDGSGTADLIYLGPAGVLHKAPTTGTVDIINRARGYPVEVYGSTPGGPGRGGVVTWVRGRADDSALGSAARGRSCAPH